MRAGRKTIFPSLPFAAGPIEGSTRQTTIRLMSGQLADDECVELVRGGNAYLKGILDRKDQFDDIETNVV
jgi:hypothetical protein